MQQFEFTVDEKYAKQDDGSSCGVYVAAAVIYSLSMTKTRTERLPEDQIKIFRENGAKWLDAAPKTWDIFLRDGYLGRRKQFVGTRLFSM
jgi:hypothetical protein